MHVGQELAGRFKLERHAGSGGMGEVYRAQDQRSGEVVAVKVLRGSGISDRTRFEREAAALADLHHPGIVRYIAHGVTPEHEPYLVMEWIEGEDLGCRLERGMLSVGDAVALALRTAQALAVAHQRGIVHRDLKPSNIFLPEGDVRRIKILDFGIARLDGATRMTATGMLMGTPGYMAPEQARSGEGIDARADLFALGCVLFECLTGVRAFAGEHVMALLAKILFDEVPRVRSLRPEVPTPLCALVSQLLAKDPERRPRNATAVAHILTALDEAALVPSTENAPMPLSAAAVALTGGERRLLSVVLIGREELAPIGALDATRAVGSIEPALPLSELARVAAAGGGHFEQLSEGSAVVTMRGTGVATDQAAQAARCALALREVAGARPLSLSTGRGELTGKQPLSDAIDRAAPRLLHSRQASEGAPPVAIDDVTAGLLDARFDVRESSTGLELYAERELPEGTRTLMGKATSCVGRDVELGTLEALFAQCMEESIAEAALITAGAGLGKSRVAHELLRRIRNRDEPTEIWIGRGDSLRAGSAFGLLGHAIRGAAGIRDGEPLTVRRSKLSARVALRVPAQSATRVSEFLGEIIGIELPDADSAPLRAARQDAQLMGQQMLRAWEDFLSAECAVAPVLLVLEDLHWGDRPTVRFIDAALGNLKQLPWMVVALARPEVHELFPRLWADRNVQEIRLGPLTRRASERLMRQVLGDRVSAEKAGRLTALSEGNAFYLEEMIRAVAEGKDEALPETVVAMVEARIASLDAPSRRILRAASVFGEVCWPSGVATLLGATDAAATTECLSVLVDRELLVRRRESRFAGEQELAFRHALLREGAYAMLTEGDRVLGHRLAGVWLEQHGESDPMVLAEHFERGGDRGHAGDFYLRAAEQAHRAGDTETTIERARRGLACDISPEVRSSLLALFCEIHAWRAEFSTAAGYADEVMRLSPPGSAAWASAALVGLGDTLQPSRIDAFMATIQLLDGQEPEPGVIAPIAFFLMAAIFLLDSICRFDLAETVLLRMRALVEPVAGRDPVARASMHMALAFHRAWANEDPWAGLTSAEIARASFQEAGHMRGVLLSRVFLGMNLWLLGALPEAAHELGGTMSAGEELGPVFSLRTLCLVGTLADQGALPEAQANAATLIEVGQTRQMPLAEERGRLALADVLRRTADLEAAEREALVANEGSTPLHRLAARATLAAIQLMQGRAAEARANIASALEQQEAHGSLGLRGAFARLVHVEALLALGERGAALAALSEARARLLARADRIGEPARRQSFLSAVPENARTLALAEEWLDHGPA
jgi:eukaryotic-like serine/threonine-protein kinase